MSDDFEQWYADNAGRLVRENKAAAHQDAPAPLTDAGMAKRCETALDHIESLLGGRNGPTIQLRAWVRELCTLSSAVRWRVLADEMPAPECFVLTWDGERVGVDWWGSLRYRQGDRTTHWCPFPTPPGVLGRSMYGLHSAAAHQDAEPARGPATRREA